jgi:hypothetical protein
MVIRDDHSGRGRLLNVEAEARNRARRDDRHQIVVDAKSVASARSARLWPPQTRCPLVVTGDDSVVPDDARF